jgi:hypothetical protein
LGYYIVGIGKLRPARFGWLIEQHPHSPAAFRAIELHSSVNAEGLAYVHPVASVWCCDDKPSPWRRFAPADVMVKAFPESSTAAARYHPSPQAHYSAVNQEAESKPGFVGMPIGDATDLNTACANMLPHNPLLILWALLATLNDLPVQYLDVRPTRGFVARGSYRKFLHHSIITLTRLHLQRMEAMLLERGFIRHPVHGFWISREQALLAAKAGAPTVDEVEDEE